MGPRPSPIDKACGEGLMPGAVAALRDLGVGPEGYPLAGIRYTNGRCRTDARFRRGPGRGVRRTVLQGALLATAHRAGVEIAVDGTGVDVDRYCVVADEPAGYERRWRAATRRYRWTTSALVRTRSRPCLAPRTVPLTAHLPGTFDSAVQHLAH